MSIPSNDMTLFEDNDGKVFTDAPTYTKQSIEFTKSMAEKNKKTHGIK